MWFSYSWSSREGSVDYQNDDNVGQSSLEQDIKEGENPVLDLNTIFILPLLHLISLSS